MPPTHAAPPAKASASARRPLARVEEPLPAPRLEGVGGEKEERRAGDEHGVGVMDRPAAADEVADADERDREEDEPEASVQDELDLPVREKPHHRSRNGAIGVTGCEVESLDRDGAERAATVAGLRK